jgi:hypothetical protein
LLFSCLFSPHLSFRVLPYRSVILDPQHLQKKLWVSEWVSGLRWLWDPCRVTGSLVREPLLSTSLSVLFVSLFLLYWGLNSGPTPWATPPAFFLMMGFLR